MNNVVVSADIQWFYISEEATYETEFPSLNQLGSLILYDHGCVVKINLSNHFDLGLNLSRVLCCSRYYRSYHDG